MTGKEITSKLLAAVRGLPNVTILEYTTMIDLVARDNRCLGIIARDKAGGYMAIEAAQTILASGGVGGLYERSTNFPHLTGDAIAIAAGTVSLWSISTTYRFIRRRCIRLIPAEAF